METQVRTAGRSALGARILQAQKLVFKCLLQVNYDHAERHKAAFVHCIRTVKAEKYAGSG